MVTFSLNTSTVPTEYITEVWQTVRNLKSYFKKNNPTVPLEAVMLQAYTTAIANYNEDYRGSNLEPYIKKLARTVMRNRSSKEIAYPTVDEESGEISYVFTAAVETTGFEVEKNVKQKIMDKLADLYLEYPETMMEIRPYILGLEKKTKPLKEKNKVVYNELMAMCSLLKEDNCTLFKLISEFYLDVDRQRKKGIQLNNTVKSIQVKPVDYRDMVRISDEDTIVFTGKYKGITAGIDKNTMQMTENLNVDLCKWEPLNKRVGVLRYDISGLMEYLTENIYVEPGVNTAHIQWIKNKYKLTSFGGFTQLNGDMNKFLDYCQREIVMSFVHNNINNVIAVSGDYIYVQPARKTGYKTLRCEGYNGKVIEVPIDVHSVV